MENGRTGWGGCRYYFSVFIDQHYNAHRAPTLAVRKIVRKRKDRNSNSPASEIPAHFIGVARCRGLRAEVISRTGLEITADLFRLGCRSTTRKRIALLLPVGSLAVNRWKQEYQENKKKNALSGNSHRFVIKLACSPARHRSFERFRVHCGQDARAPSVRTPSI